ncbi:hypothetical protein C8F04DRAFT_1101363 [Mycena alexandri]|uniref:F-box domain-containing protein n=1 Tax=Mycena alexandri TaxID=1745969 RepID=A0AAD6SW72_9AGAR|nr:hypothetical protein C8F04DRAFT_1101363 [Mycena alexandri]
MALARLVAAPLEIQYLASSELGPSDLLALSHVSTYWRAFVLSDKRWAEWFNLITSLSEETFEACLTRFNIIDLFSKRKLVYLCLRDSCSVCGEYAQEIFLPHMKRVCEVCLPNDEFTVLSFSAALAKYDLRERDLAGILTLESRSSTRRTTKLVSESQVKQIALRYHGTPEALERHLEFKKADARTTYTARSTDYRNAVDTRTALADKGNVAAAEAVVLARTGRKIPKAFPVYPAILLPARPVERMLVCFAPQPLMEVGGEVIRDESDEESRESSGSGSGSMSGSEV